MEAMVETSSQTDAVSPRASRKKTQRLRSNRSILPEPAQQRLSARLSHASAGSFDASVLDVSIHGARVAVPALRLPWALQLGDQLDLTLMSDGAVIYAGSATIARLAEEAKQWSVGLALDASGLDLGLVERIGLRENASERWLRARHARQTDHVSGEFRAWVSVLAAQLGHAQSFLDREEAEMAAWDMATRNAHAEELLAVVAPDVVALMNRAGAEIGRMVAELPKDLHSEYRAVLQSGLGSLLSRAPFLARAKQKPLGYAGDYEMMNMLYRDHREGATLFGKAMNLYATQQPVARANINRIAYIGGRIEEQLRRKPSGRVRIVSIGCGPAHEVYSFLSSHPELGQRLEVALIDQEERAIAHCERTLSPLAARTGARISVIKASARRLLTDQKLGEALGLSDLVYSAGLFDYLADRSFAALLAVLWGAVERGGTLLVGNVAAHNPDRWAMEYFTEWFLYHRTPEDLLQQAAQLESAPAHVHVEAEPTGVNLFLVAQR
jgi:extracellular factor (EF) 3-hydroxypalmitic acid methyl ester biosynthesis protein